MSNPGDYERTTETDTPEGVRRETYRETAPAKPPSGAAGWWIAAVVALVAAIGLAVLFANQNRQDDLQAARDQGAAQATVTAAAADAQRSAVQASQAAQTAVDSTARASQRAAEAAQSAASQTAQSTQSTAASAGEAARNAAAAEPEPAPAQ